MFGYNAPRRNLSWELLNPAATHRTTEDDGDCEPSSFVWPLDSDERVVVPFLLSLNEYNVLASTIDVGSDIAYGEDALRVNWLWLRNMRCNVDLCELMVDCIIENPHVMAQIIEQLTESMEFREFILSLVEDYGPGDAMNVYPDWPTLMTPDPLCNAATYIVAQLKTTFQAIYSDLATLTPEEILASLLGLFGWRSGPLYNLIGVLEASGDQSALIAAFDAASPDLICALVDSQLDQMAVELWIAATYPPPSVLGDALLQGLSALATEGKYSQWIAVGALIDAPDCGCEPDCTFYDFELSDGGFVPLIPGYANWLPGEGWARASGADFGRLGIQGAVGNFKSVLMTFSETPGVQSFVQLINYPYPPYTAKGPVNAANTTSLLITQVSTDGGLAFDLGATLENASVNPLPETFRIKSMLVCR